MQETWDDIWKNFKGWNLLGARFKREEELELGKIFDSLNPSKSVRIIDIGCGTGFVLSFLKIKGYKNAIGIDKSENSLLLCQKLFGLIRNKDIFLMDCRKLKFPNNHFDIVISEGLLEHFKNMASIAREMCRISKKYVLLIQPNPVSIYGRIKTLISKVFPVSWEKEYSYTKQDYINVFNTFGFILKDCGKINFDEIVWLLFRRSK